MQGQKCKEKGPPLPELSDGPLSGSLQWKGRQNKISQDG